MITLQFMKVWSQGTGDHVNIKNITGYLKSVPIFNLLCNYSIFSNICRLRIFLESLLYPDKLYVYIQGRYILILNTYSNGGIKVFFLLKNSFCFLLSLLTPFVTVVLATGIDFSLFDNCPLTTSVHEVLSTFSSLTFSIKR